MCLLIIRMSFWVQRYFFNILYEVVIYSNQRQQLVNFCTTTIILILIMLNFSFFIIQIRLNWENFPCLLWRLLSCLICLLLFFLWLIVTIFLLVNWWPALSDPLAFKFFNIIVIIKWFIISLLKIFYSGTKRWLHRNSSYQLLLLCLIKGLQVTSSIFYVVFTLECSLHIIISFYHLRATLFMIRI